MRVSDGEDELARIFRYHVIGANDVPEWRANNASDPLMVTMAAVGDGRSLAYVFPWNADAGYVFDFDAGVRTALPAHLRVGSHYSVELLDDTLALVGGHGRPSGELQLYSLNSKKWSKGASVPWSAGAMATVVIANELYACGGAVRNTVVNYCGKRQGCSGDRRKREAEREGQ